MGSRKKGSKKSKKNIDSASEKPGKQLIIDGYLVLPIIINIEPEQLHYLYIKKHGASANTTSEGPSLDPSKTLFIVNLPVDCSVNTLKTFFKPIARVSKVLFSDIAGSDIFQKEYQKACLFSDTTSSEAHDQIQPVEFGTRLKSGSCCHVQFLEESETTRVLSLSSTSSGVFPVPHIWPAISNSNEDSSDISTNTLSGNSETQQVSPSDYKGLQRYLFEYRGLRPPQDLLSTELSQYMIKFEKKQYERERLYSAQKNVPDEDGFVTVVHNKHRFKKESSFADPSAHLSSNPYIADKIKKRQDKIHSTSFYRWQQRENNKNAAELLKLKFQQDREKISKLKQSRKFKPY
ncbi:Ribosomal RNA-processing protein 7 [Smittium mucronatum]|uniref:Ribosomal RNA-processing protein 7 n=1 Tax=Smittium mucronatum TaxID=133383 RepID=A0A1R0GY64_9FUNG|nr:Ribosomal RNA-processing protein 7 [Smittium mucronatum]